MQIGLCRVVGRRFYISMNSHLIPFESVQILVPAAVLYYNTRSHHPKDKVDFSFRAVGIGDILQAKRVNAETEVSSRSLCHDWLVMHRTDCASQWSYVLDDGAYYSDF